MDQTGLPRGHTPLVGSNGPNHDPPEERAATESVKRSDVSTWLTTQLFHGLITAIAHTKITASLYSLHQGFRIDCWLWDMYLDKNITWEVFSHMPHSFIRPMEIDDESLYGRGNPSNQNESRSSTISHTSDAPLLPSPPQTDFQVEPISGLPVMSDRSVIAQAVKNNGVRHWLRKFCRRSIYKHVQNVTRIFRESTLAPFQFYALMDNRGGDVLPVIMQLDTACRESLIDVKTARRFYPNFVPTAEENFAKTITGAPLSSCGRVTLRWHGLDPRFRTKFETTKFRVVNYDLEVDAVLGYKEIKRLGIDLNRPMLEPLGMAWTSRTSNVNAGSAVNAEQRAHEARQAEIAEMQRDRLQRERHAYACTEANRSMAAHFDQAGLQPSTEQYNLQWWEYYRFHEANYLR